MTLPKNTLKNKNIKYLDAVLRSSDDCEINPSNCDMYISIVGSTMRKIFKAIPGRNPWMNDLMEGLDNS
jgi:hypothetical protein